MVHGENRIPYWIDRRLPGLAGPEYHATIRISEHEPILQRHRQLMVTVRAKKLYRRRIAIVEPVFGLLKEWHDARRFLLRGRSHVVSEWHLLATSFNLKSLHAVWRSGVIPASPLGAGPLRQQTPFLTAAPPRPQDQSPSLSPFCSYHPPSDCVPHPTHHAPYQTMRHPQKGSVSNMTEAEKVGRVYSELVECASRCETISYSDLSERAGLGRGHARSIGVQLAFIAGFCWARGLPCLTSLVVRSDTGRPGDGYVPVLESVEQDREAVYGFDWPNASAGLPATL